MLRVVNLGSKNKVNNDNRESFHWAFEQAGAKEKLAEFARSNPQTFYQIYGRMAPKEIDVSLKTQEIFIEDLAKKELMQEARVEITN